MTGNDTHADTIREALDTLRGGIRFSEDREWVEAEIREITEAADALVAELEEYDGRLLAVGETAERERARADRAEAALAAFLEWAEKDKGGYQFSDPSEEWFAIRDYVRAALSAGSGGRET